MGNERISFEVRFSSEDAFLPILLKTKLDGELVASESFSNMSEVCNAMESNTRGLDEYLETENGVERWRD